MAATSLSDEIIAQNRLVEENLAIVGYHVSEVLRRVPAHVEREELASAGAEALVRAARSFDSSLGVPFARYAATRVRGALIDELRSMDWISRGARARVRAYSDTVDRLTGILGRKPSEEEVAESLGVGINEVRAAREDSQRRTVSIDEEPIAYANIGSNTANPEEHVLASERIRYMNAAVDELPEKLRTVIVALYRQDVPVKDLAERMGVSQSRISQLRTQALDLMREAVNAALSPEQAPLREESLGVAARRRLAYFEAVAQSGAARPESPRHADVMPEILSVKGSSFSG